MELCRRQTIGASTMRVNKPGMLQYVSMAAEPWDRARTAEEKSNHSVQDHRPTPQDYMVCSRLSAEHMPLTSEFNEQIHKSRYKLLGFIQDFMRANRAYAAFQVRRRREGFQLPCCVIHDRASWEVRDRGCEWHSCCRLRTKSTTWCSAQVRI
jgi:hypothetical protein